MIHLRIVAPPTLAERALDLLWTTPSVMNVVHLPDASRRPDGDLILADVAREDASIVVDELCGLGLDLEGSIALDSVETTISNRAKHAERAAAGSPADAVVWEEVEARTSESAELSLSFVAFMTLAAMIAAVGIVTDSQILIIGAMVVGPEFGPIAGVCVAAVERRAKLARRSLLALGVGFPVSIGLTYLATALARATGIVPATRQELSHPATLFISNPNRFSFIVAVLAGITGVLSLTTAKSGALIGVLISVTTVPAAANIAVAAAYRDWGESGGALQQLLLNLAAMILAGTATLAVQRAAYARHRTEFLRRRRRRLTRSTAGERRD